MKRKKCGLLWSRDNFRFSVSLLLAFAMACCYANPNGCSFPEFLQTEGDYSTWLFNLTRAGIITDQTQIHYIRVDSGLMKTYVLEREGGQFNRTCLEDKGNNTFVVYEIKEHNKQSTEFLCMKFIRRSKTVVELEVSEKANTPRADLCDNLKLEERPLLRSSRDAAQQCPLTGGYNMKVYRSSGEPLCHHLYTTPRLESSCMGDEFMQFNFQDCHMENVIVDMEKLQNLDCTGTWHDGENTFVILSRRDLLGFWCLRYPTNHGDEFDAYLFSDVVCERTSDVRKSKMYARLHLKKQVYTSICSDASDDCEMESVDITCGIATQFGKTYCKQKCTTCANEDGVLCEFKPEILGTWLPIGDQPLKNITLHNAATLLPLGQMPCKDQRKYFDEYKLISYSEDGCYPRFYCFSAKAVSPSIMIYKMLRGPKWPMYELDYIPCSDDKYDRENRYFQYFVNEWSPAVSLKSATPVAVACEFPEVSYAIDALFADGTRCRGRLYKPDCLEDEAKTMTLRYQTCNNQSHESVSKLICHAHIPSDNERYLLVSEENTGVYYCLLFSYYSTSASELSILPPDKCNSDGYFFHRMVKMTLETEEHNHCNENNEKSPTLDVSSVEGLPVGHENHTYKIQTTPRNNIQDHITNTSYKNTFSLLNLLIIFTATIALLGLPHKK